MKSVKIIGYRLAAIVLLAMLPIVMSAVEYKNSYKPSGISNQRAAGVQVAAPSAAFQSTSTLPGSGSALSATPMLGDDGTATLEGAASAPAQAPNGPRKSSVFDDDDEDMPLGDAVLPLLFMSLAFCGYLYLRRKRSAA